MRPHMVSGDEAYAHCYLLNQGFPIMRPHMVSGD